MRGLNKEIRRRYHDLLKSPEWRFFSGSVIAGRDGCEWCGEQDGLHVHHRLYRDGAMPWEYDQHEVAVLCKQCHNELHWIADDCWNELLRLDRPALELVLKFLRGIDTADDAKFAVVEATRRLGERKLATHE